MFELTKVTRRIVLVILLLLAAALLVAAPVAAQDTQSDSVSDDAVNAIAKGLYCPVCENIPLDVCGTQACAQWRELIREKLAQGWSEAQIKQYFVAQYGDRVLATPPARGLNWLVYIIPPLAILIGGFILYTALKSWRQSTPQEAVPIPNPDQPADEYVARLEEELSKR